MKFEPFPKMARLTRECIITEKIDGTNAQICIAPMAVFPDYEQPPLIVDGGVNGGFGMWAGSRTRWLGAGGKQDNFGFAAWVLANATELFKLGPGRHYGEWWGPGIQRGYGLAERKFSLFNTTRWGVERPACCDVVPVLYEGLFHESKVEQQLERLKHVGSVASPGFMRPEGVVVYHTASNTMFKKVLENDALPKSQA